MEHRRNRRGFLKLGAGTTGAWLLAGPLRRAFASVTPASSPACGLETPEQTAGPFFPGEPLFHPETDLTRISGHCLRAQGQVVLIQGQVLDLQCRPIGGANVEIWQACASGRYNNPKDDNPAPIDPNFKYWGETLTDETGSYRFKTIIPGAYPADTDWMRPPHVHFNVSRLGYHDLITQMYFKGSPLNDRDLILLAIPASERDRVIVEFTPWWTDPETLIGRFDLTLTSVR